MKRIPIEHVRIIHQNNLVIRIYYRNGGKGPIIRLSQGKRVPKDFPLSREERRAYTKHTFFHASYFIATNRRISIDEARHILNSALTPMKKTYGGLPYAEGDC